MALDDIKSENNSNNSGNNNVNKSNATSPLFALLSSQSLISSNNNMMEVNDAVKSIEETIKALNKNTASEAQKMALPKNVQNMTSDISPQLPGITLSTVIGARAYVMPVLFYKSGVTEVTESIYLQNESVPRGIAKPATSFMDMTVLEKVKTQYAYQDGKQMEKVIILAPMVLNLEPYLKNSIKYEDMIIDIRTAILKEWATSLLNIAYLDLTVVGIDMPNPFKDGKMFGKEDAAVARIEPVNKLTIDGRPTPYNLAVKIATTNKNNTQNLNSSQSRSVCTSYLTVSLEAMSPSQFQQNRAQNPGRVVGPLVPVISTGTVVPGETLNNNNSMLTALLGLYGAIGANQPSYFAEALRGKDVGNRGNIGNFNFYLSQVLQGNFGTGQYITDKNITNAQVVNQWLNTYVAPNAVYVLDLATFSEDVANSDFWWNLLNKPSSSTYHRALVNLLDTLSNKEFSKLAAQNAQKGDRNRAKEWAAGDAILRATNIMMPSGIAQGKDGKWFSLDEVDGMFLRQEQYYGNNEAAINEYQGLVNGSVGGDNLKVRQFNIFTRLNALFQGNVIIEGWKRRLIWENAFFNTFAQSMVTAGALSLSGSNMASMWSMNSNNDYLNYAISTVLSQNMQVAALGLSGGYTQY